VALSSRTGKNVVGQTELNVEPVSFSTRDRATTRNSLGLDARPGE
jgi:hypothetical protein